MQAGGHEISLRQGLPQPTEKNGGVPWRPYVPQGTKKIGSSHQGDDNDVNDII